MGWGRENCKKNEVGQWKIFTGRNCVKEVQREQGVIIFGRIIKEQGAYSKSTTTKKPWRFYFAEGAEKKQIEGPNFC